MNPRNATVNDVPMFSLYGEDTTPTATGFVHIELIETRSRVHDWHISRHTHRGLFQVLFLTAGHVTARLDDAVHACDGPVALTLSPSVVHGFDFSQEAQGFVLTMDQQIVFSAKQEDEHGMEPPEMLTTLFMQPLVIELREADEIRLRLASLCEHLLTESSWPLVGQGMMLEWLARSAMLLLVRLQADRHFASPRARSDFSVFSRFRQLIELHYTQHLPIGWYAAQLHMNPARLNRLCLQIAGKTGFELTQQRLMQEACRILTYSPSGVAEIAYALGFDDPAYFSRMFKRHTGLAPKKFQQQAMAEGGANLALAGKPEAT